ncbi:hypothetical protein DFH29DRAFT_476267 [Suillus ampliporus]|nr:hypothetical protein DFH29DRAFT_476267 [Suillus ampliporus]
MQVTSARLDAPWWTDPELRDGNPRKEHDIYSFGCVMYHVSLKFSSPYPLLVTMSYTQVLAQVPWHTIHIRRDIKGATSCLATSDSLDITEARRKQIKKCWLPVGSRLSASDAIEFLNSELNSALSGNVPPSQATLRSFTRPTPDPLNVLLFGDVRVGNSSVIDLIVTGDAAQIEETCTLRHTSREVSVGDQRFKLWEASSIKSMGFFRTLFFKRGLKQSCKELYGDKGICLLLCCMRGSSTPKTLVKDYNFFTDIIGSTVGPDRLPIAVVVNHDDWLQQNQENLIRLNMPFYKDACIISLPDDHQNTPELRRKAEDALCKLICDFYQPRPIS